MKKCQICKKEQAEYSWQPAGPDPDRRNCFPFLGWHYRGYVAINTCEKCKDEIKSGKDIRFTYMKSRFVLQGQQIHKLTAGV